MNMHTNSSQYLTSAAAKAGDFPLVAGHLPHDEIAPNNGAHRLLHWLCEGTRTGRADERLVLLNRYGVSDETIDRLIDGTLEPGDDLARDVARATEGDVLPADWVETPGAHWTVLPVQRRGVA